MVFSGEFISFESFKKKWSGETEPIRMVLELSESHNEQMAQLIGKDFSEGTLKRYKTSPKHTRNFIQWKYKRMIWISGNLIMILSRARHFVYVTCKVAYCINLKQINGANQPFNIERHK